MSVAVTMNCSGTSTVRNSEFSLATNVLDVLTLLFLFANFTSRVPVLFQYPVVLQVGVLSVLLSCFFSLVYPRFFKFFLFAFACSLPWYGSHSYHVHNIVFELFVSTLAFIFLLQKRYMGRTESIRNTLPVLLLFYILLAGLSLLLLPLRSIFNTLLLWGWWDFSMFAIQAPPESALYPLTAVNRLLLFFVFIFQLSCNVDRDRLYRIIFSGLVTGAVLAACIGILCHYHWLSLDWFREPMKTGRRLQSVMGNSGWFAEFLSISIPFILLGFLNSRISKLSGVGLFGLLIICGMAIFLTISRTGWLIYPLILVSCWFVFYVFDRVEVGCLTWGTVCKICLKVLISVPLTIIVSYFLLTGIVQQNDSETAKMLQERFLEISNPAERKKIWQESMAMGREAPLFGLGYESYKLQKNTLASIADSLYSKDRKIRKIDYDTPHNQYLQIFISNGVVGLFFWLVLVSYSVIVLFYDLIINKKLFNFAVLISIIAFHLYGFAQSMQYVSVIWFLVFLSFGYTMTLDEAVLPEGVRKFAKFFVLLSAALIITGGMVYAGNVESRLLAKRYGLQEYAVDQNQNTYSGFYPKEDWGEQGIFRWTGRRAAIQLDKSGVVGFNFSCSAPGLSVRPIVMQVLLDGCPLDQITFWSNKIIFRNYFIPSQKHRETRRIELQVSRTWNPRQEGISSDFRNLGVAVSEPTFKRQVPADGIGFYGWQMATLPVGERKGNRELRFRWTRQEAVLNVEGKSKKNGFLLLKSEQPYLKTHPVTVQFFQQSKKISTVQLADHNWSRVQFPHKLRTDLPLVIRVSRIWNPKREGYSNDSRDLGVAIAVLSADASLLPVKAQNDSKK